MRTTIPISCVIIENDKLVRKSIESSLRHALRQDYSLNVRAIYKDIDEAIWKLRAGKVLPGWQPPDLISADLFRSENNESPEVIADAICEDRIPKLTALREVVGPTSVLIVVSKYVGYFLKNLEEKPEEASAVIDRIRTDLKESEADIAVVIDKFSPSEVGTGFEEAKVLLKRRLAATREGIAR